LFTETIFEGQLSVHFFVEGINENLLIQLVQLSLSSHLSHGATHGLQTPLLLNFPGGHWLTQSNESRNFFSGHWVHLIKELSQYKQFLLEHGRQTPLTAEYPTSHEV
jgi:hypothetical protein